MKYKVQHYVPVVYMRNWSTDPLKRNRQSRIWRYLINNHSCQNVKAKKEGCDDFYYSKTAAEVAEKSFHEMENDYGRIADPVIAGTAADSPRDQLQWLFIATDLFVRNAVHKNLTGDENYAAYQQRSIMFTKQLAGLTNTDDMQVVCDAMLQKWSVHFLYYDSTPDTHLITSDVPCVPLNLMGPKEHCFYMPIAPNVGMLAAKNDVVIASNKLTHKDVTFLNQAIILNAQLALYSSDDLTIEKDFGKIVDKWRARTARLTSTWDGRVWDIQGPTYYILPDFLQRDR